jgi:hypothetical protein
LVAGHIEVNEQRHVARIAATTADVRLALPRFDGQLDYAA